MATPKRDWFAPIEVGQKLLHTKRDGAPVELYVRKIGTRYFYVSTNGSDNENLWTKFSLLTGEEVGSCAYGKAHLRPDSNQIQIQWSERELRTKLLRRLFELGVVPSHTRFTTALTKASPAKLEAIIKILEGDPDQ